MSLIGLILFLIILGLILPRLGLDGQILNLIYLVLLLVILFAAFGFVGYGPLVIR